MNLAVDVISDVICSWCYIGKRRLEKAIAALDDQHDVQYKRQVVRMRSLRHCSGLTSAKAGTSAVNER